MRWDADRRNGWIGWNPGRPPQPRFLLSNNPELRTVTPDAIARAALPWLSLYRLRERHKGVPLYSGGLLDSWPAAVVDAFGILDEEWPLVISHVALEGARNV